VTERKVLITGATGFIGSALTQLLISNGFKVVILSTTRSDPSKGIYRWDPKSKTTELPLNTEYFAIINLAGASIADTPWNQRGQKIIKESRVNSTLFLKTLVEKFPVPPIHFISTLAIGYYGLKDDSIKNESSQGGDDFAAMVCREWENAAHQHSSDNTQLSIIRIGIVMGKNGGFFQKIKKLSQWKIAAPIGNGEQPVCWIHLDDLTRLYSEILNNNITPGTYNAVSVCQSNKLVTSTIAALNGQKFIWPAIPSFMVKFIFGKKAEIFTKGSRVSSAKLIQSGFSFNYTDLKKAVLDLNSN